MPGAFPGGKGGRCVGVTTLQPSYAVVMKSGNLNFLEPSGPLQACNGTAFTMCIVGETVISEYSSRAIIHKIATAEGLGENNSLKWEFLILFAENSMSFIVGRLVGSNLPV